MGVIQAFLLLQEVGVHPQERRQRVHGVDDAEGIGELRAKSVHGVDDEVMVGDGVANVDEGVREALEVATKVVNGEVTLLQIVKVLQSIDNVLRGIVEEELADGVPCGERRHTALEHHVLDGLGHSEVNPRNNAVVI